MEETEELIQLSVRALAAQVNSAPGVELHMTRSCVVALTQEPLADFNRLLVGACPEAEDFLVRAVAMAKERARPLLATMSPAAAQRLAFVAERHGLKRVGAAPLMVLRPSVAVRADYQIKIVRALGQDLVQLAGDMISAAFDEPRDLISRYIEVCMTETSGVETYVGFSDAGRMCTVSVTRAGNAGAVSLMATPPEHQRNGMGRAVLSQVIDHYRNRGVQRFHLGATAAGLPLYTSLGFQPVADLSVWLLEITG